MYVAWKRRFSRDFEHRRGQFERLYAWEACLVESARTPDGPRQRHVLYLGRVEENYCSADHWLARQERGRFWHGAIRRMDGLGGNRLPPEVRAEIEASLAERVPRTDPIYWTERERFRREAIAAYAAAHAAAKAAAETV
jgi:hypothetical protein